MSARTIALEALRSSYEYATAINLEPDQWEGVAVACTNAVAALEAEIAQEVEPVAYAIFAENGNIRVWTTAEQYVQRIAEEQGQPLIKLYTAPQAVNAWQPIETAPKDGSVFLITDGHHVYAGFRRPQDATWPWGIFDDTDPQPAGCCEGEDVDRVPFNSLKSDRPTHWMPLPGVPA